MLELKYPGEVVIDPVAGSAISLIAAMELGRQAYGFEIKKNFYKDAVTLINEKKQVIDDIKNYGYAKEKIKESQPILF
jgi:DNA modification methylase